MRIAFPEAQDPRVREAAQLLADEGILSPLLVADPEVARELTDEAGEGFLVRDASQEADGLSDRLQGLATRKPLSDEAARQAVQVPLTHAALLMDRGDVDGVVAGAVHATADVLRTGLRVVGFREGNKTLSSSFYMAVRAFRQRSEEVLTFSDAGVIPEPTVPQLVDIAREASFARRRIVGDEPKVAFVSFSTHGSADGPSVRRMREASELFRRQEPDILSDGELQADAALIPEVAARKCPDSPLGGMANVLIFPNLDAGNLAYKLVQRLAGAVALGPILQGLSLPLNDLSRGATPQDIADVAYITALMVAEK